MLSLWDSLGYSLVYQVLCIPRYMMAPSDIDIQVSAIYVIPVISVIKVTPFLTTQVIVVLRNIAQRCQRYYGVRSIYH